MAQHGPIGHLEQLLLTAVLTLGDDAYGVTIHETVVELYGRSVSLGAVYATFDRLQDKGLRDVLAGGSNARAWWAIQAALQAQSRWRARPA